MALEGIKSVALVSMVLAVLITATYTYYITIYREKIELCETIECVNQAARVLNSMDMTADPCNDFYQYACGGWIKNNPIAKDRAFLSQFSLANDKTQKLLKEVLSSDYSKDRDAIKKAKIYYKACVNEEVLEEQCALPTYDFIKKLGGFPLFDGKQNKRGFNLEKYLAKTTIKIADEYLKKSSPILNIDVDADDTNSTRNIIIIDQPLLGMTNEKYYLSKEFDSIQVAYRKFLHDLLLFMWKRLDKENNATTFDDKALNDSINEVYQLETELAAIIEPKENRLDKRALHNKMSLKDMSSKISPDFNWIQYVREVMAKVDISVGPSTEIVAKGTPYLSKLMQVLKKYDKRVIQNYVVIHNIAGFVDLLSKKYRDTDAEYRKATTGTDQRGVRWGICISKANTFLANPVGAIHAKAAFPEDSKKVAVEMINNIVTSFKDQLEEIDWMDDETKKEAKLKVDALGEFIGFPDFILDESDPRMDDELKEVEISESEFYKAEIDLHENQLRKHLKRLNQPVDRQRWGIAPAAVDAFYDVTKNSMFFASGVFQPPFFSPALPFAMNYGGIGDAIGHELTHGFDTTGSTYNAVGSLENRWSNFSRKQFEDASQCIRDQYSNMYYETAGMFLNGNLTIREDLADIGGIKSSYYGYQLWRTKNPGREFQLPGLQKYSAEQMFFIGNGQTWCEVERPENAKRRIMSFYHTPGIFRAEGAMKNFDEFGKAFGCKKGIDRLYPDPEDTCNVW